MGLFRVFCHGQTPGERKLGKEPPLCLSLSLSLSLFRLYFSIISTSFSLTIFTLFSVYLYDFVARRFRSHSVLTFFSLLASVISKPSSSCYFFGLGKMMKRKIRVSVDLAPSSSFLVGEENRSRFKHQCLLQDYQVLLKETEGKKERLNKALQRKLKLLAEVKFLSKKYQSLSNIPRVSAKPCRVKRQSCKEVTQPYHPVIGTKPPLKERNLKSKEVSVQSFPKLTDLNRFKVLLKERNRKTNEAFVQGAPQLLDLNQVSLPNGEEMELDAKWEPLKIDKLKRTFIEGDAMVDDIKFSVCREIGSSQSGWGTGKFHGKISSL